MRHKYIGKDSRRFRQRVHGITVSTEIRADSSRSIRKFLTGKAIHLDTLQIATQTRVSNNICLTKHLPGTSFCIKTNFFHKILSAICIVVPSVIVIPKIIVKATCTGVCPYNQIRVLMTGIPILLAAFLTSLYRFTKTGDVAGISSTSRSKVTTGLCVITVIPKVLLERIELCLIGIVQLTGLRIIFSFGGDIVFQGICFKTELVICVLCSIVRLLHLHNRLCQFVVCEWPEIRITRY